VSFDLDYAGVVMTEIIEGVLRVAVDRYGQVGQSGATLPTVMPHGLLSRPLDPPPTIPGVASSGGAGALVIDGGNETFVIPTTDPNLAGKFPEPTKGCTILYSAKAFLSLDAENNDVSLLQPGQDNDNLFAMSAKPGEEAIQLIHVSGSKLTFLKDGSIVLMGSSGDAYIEINSSGISLNGNVTVNGGMSVGGSAALPVLLGPLPGTPSTIFKAL
jgi:hypothetical protein